MSDLPPDPTADTDARILEFVRNGEAMVAGITNAEVIDGCRTVLAATKASIEGRVDDVARLYLDQDPRVIAVAQSSLLVTLLFNWSVAVRMTPGELLDELARRYTAAANHFGQAAG